MLMIEQGSEFYLFYFYFTVFVVSDLQKVCELDTPTQR